MKRLRTAVMDAKLKEEEGPVEMRDPFSDARSRKAAAVLNPRASALVGRKMGSLSRVLSPVATRSEAPRV